MAVLCFLRVIITAALTLVGVSYIVKTNGYTDLLMNGVTLVFVATIASGLYNQVLREEFAERLAAMEYRTSMGPKGMLKPDNATPSADAIDLLWEYLLEGSDSPTLSFEMMRARLQAMSLVAPENMGG